MRIRVVRGQVVFSMRIRNLRRGVVLSIATIAVMLFASVLYRVTTTSLPPLRVGMTQQEVNGAFDTSEFNRGGRALERVDAYQQGPFAWERRDFVYVNYDKNMRVASWEVSPFDRPQPP
jgi:hypothetical protein